MSDFRRFRSTGTSFLLAVLALALLAGGCQSISKRYAKSEQTQFRGLDIYGFRKQSPTLNADNLAQLAPCGPVSDGAVEVFHSRGLEATAAGVARLMQLALDQVNERTGVRIRERLRMYLIRVDELPQSYEFAVRFKERLFAFPLFVKVGTTTAEEVFAQNKFAPYLLTHELTEMAIVNTDTCTPVLCDIDAGIASSRHYTRWFREGLANYAGYVASEAIREASGVSSGESPFPHPFSSLSRVGGDLFRWHQFSPTSLNADNYDAAFGLMLLIRDRYGEDAIRRIVEGLPSLKYADGKAIIALADKVTGGDIRKLAEDLKFPDTGLTLEALTPAAALNRGLAASDGPVVTDVARDSAAFNADVEREDIIVSIEGTPVRGGLDLELALLESSGRPWADVVVERGGRRRDVRLDIARAVEHKPRRPADRESGTARAPRGLSEAAYSWNFSFE